MQPDLDIRLKAMIKAMTEVVLPAVDSSNSAAVEQARLVTASIALVREQVDYLHWYAATEARELMEFGRALVESWSGVTGASIESAILDAMKVAARADVPTSSLTAANRALREALSAGIAEALGSGDPAVRERVEHLVLERSEALLRLERSFVAPTGFEVDRQGLASIRETLDGMR
ncbi:MAG: hypothetical protein ABL996_24705 [Micropepsaceae bacterium]